MSQWFRVFGNGDATVDPAALLGHLHGAGFPVAGHFRGDDRGWFRAELLPDGGGMVEVECYLAGEEGIRHELNSWAAWLEAAGEGAEHARLMRHMIATTRLFGFHDDIAIRIRPDGAQGSRVDVRSKSRDGKGDIGANAARIRAFVGELEQGAGRPPA